MRSYHWILLLLAAWLPFSTAGGADSGQIQSVVSAVTTANGVRLLVRSWPLPTGITRRGAALVIHGLGEHSGGYDELAALLNSQGLEVRGYDQRGFGASGGERGTLPDEMALVDDAKLMFDALAAQARAKGDPQPPFVFGHSMGGLVAARASTGGFFRPRGLMLSSPALRTNASELRKMVITLACFVAPDHQLSSGLPLDRISHDPAVVAQAKADPLRHDRITPRLIHFVITAGETTLRDAAGFHVPTLLLVAGDDALVDASGAREFAGALPAGVGTLHWYEGLYHRVLFEREPDRGRVRKDLSTWVAQQLGAL